MSLTLANFKLEIPGHILERGRAYWSQGRIGRITFDEADGLWRAVVQGTMPYAVEVLRAPNGALSCDCSCPYDLTEHCKHVAAVLYAIEAQFPGYVVAAPAKKGARRPSRLETLRTQLEKAPQAQIIEILLELAEDDRELLKQLLARFEGGPVDHRRALRDILKPGAGYYEFLDYYGSERAAHKIQKLMAKAERWTETGETAKALEFYKAVIDEVTPAIAHADDSNGSLAGCIGDAILKLDEILETIDPKAVEELFDYCTERVRKAEFREWDWGWALLNMALALVDSPERRRKLESALDAMEAEERARARTEFSSEYSLERVVLARLRLIDDFDGAESALAFLRANKELDPIRMELIDRHIKAVSLAEAMELIQEGISTTEQRRLPGLTNRYLALRLKVLKHTGDKSQLLAAMRDLWLRRHDDQLYPLLKQIVGAGQWPAFVDGLVKDLKDDKKRIADVFAREERWRDLLETVQTLLRPEWLLEPYRAPLESRFPDEVAALYEVVMEQHIAKGSRPAYQEAVNYLRRIRAVAGAERASTVLERVRSRHMHKRALLNELGRF